MRWRFGPGAVGILAGLALGLLAGVLSPSGASAQFRGLHLRSG